MGLVGAGWIFCRRWMEAGGDELSSRKVAEGLGFGAGALTIPTTYGSWSCTSSAGAATRL